MHDVLQELCLDFYLPPYSLITCCCQSDRGNGHHEPAKDDSMGEPVESIFHTPCTE